MEILLNILRNVLGVKQIFGQLYVTQSCCARTRDPAPLYASHLTSPKQINSVKKFEYLTHAVKDSTSRC
jgi:hypothetical protein